MARKILLADDSVTAQNMGRRILTDAGYDVTTVNNGSAALKKIAESKPDVIVLDVYMPGYGGLEVCQRLREAPETARIPVLLTVGKLEPFKADESRRVRADDFIVKPFEASELLTALAKLEDKIVPQGQPQKASRFAKAMAAANDSAQAKEFGNSETGWKSRLSIPPPHAKPREAEREEEPAASGNHGSSTSSEPMAAEPKSGLEEALMSSLPQDVTAEEIAAIKAAAATFNRPIEEIGRPDSVGDQPQGSTQPVGNAQERPPETVVGREKETGAATFASAPEAQAETPPENIPAAVEATFSNTGEKDAVSEVVALVPVSSNSLANTATQSPGTDLGDEEVTAALASLAPSNGHGEAATATESLSPDWAARERTPVTMAAGAAPQEFSGPRWIAEPVGVGESESSLILEQEMERAFAAFAAADAARLSFTSSTIEPNAPVPPAETAAAVPEGSPSPAESFSASAESERHNEAVSPSVDAISERVVAEVREDAALAAAAAMGSSATGSMPAEALPQPVPQTESSENAPHSDPVEPHGESELAAAWANWKHIRESVLGSPADSQVAESMPAEPKPAVSDASPAETEPPSAESLPSGEEVEKISNIVDSILADLKPRLMQEIAKKMGKEQKKK